MAIRTKNDEERYIHELEQSRVDEIDKAELVVGKRNAGPPPISLRLSTPLVEALDRIARSEDRKRSNLIQHILWEYVHERNSSKQHAATSAESSQYPVMEQNIQPTILGLPDEFDLTADEARALGVDAIIADASFDHGLWGAMAPLAEARNAAQERGDRTEANALHLLGLVAGMMPADNARAPFGRYMSGSDAQGNPWHTPLPADLTERHTGVLTTLLDVVKAPVLRARLADVLWHRVRPRNPDLARAAVDAYLHIAEETFSPDHWVLSEQYFARAFMISARLGTHSSEHATVVAKAWSFLTRLNENDPLYYTDRIVSRIIGSLSVPQATTLFDRVKGIAKQSLSTYDFERSRTYYELAIDLARKIQRLGDVRSLRLAKAETHATQAVTASNEMQRSMYLRIARQELLNVGASRERIAEVSAMLDESQILAVNEMAPIGSQFSLGQLPDYVRDIIRGHDPIKRLWILAGVPVMLSRQRARAVAEDSVQKHVFAYGFGRRHLSRDGRQQGETPGAIGGTEADREAAVLGAMRDNAAQGRMYAVLGAIEPGRSQLLLEHEYTLAEIYAALRPRPLIPQGHHLLWAKAIHAGLVGEYDVAVHILAPQIENALREVLRQQGELVYSTRDGVQSLLSVENVLDHPKSQLILGEDFIFALDTSLAGRLGANVRNEVAHGIVDDVSSNSYDSAFVWWLALRLLRSYGPDALASEPARG